MRYKVLENELYERWDEILERMKVDFDISDVSYRTFIKKLSLYGVIDNAITTLEATANSLLNRNTTLFFLLRLKKLLMFIMNLPTFL